MANIKMSEMSIDSSIDGTERILEQGADGLVVLVSGISSYTIDTLAALAAIVPTTGDAVVSERGGTAGTFDLDAMSDYAIARGWSAASTVTPAVSGDLLLLDRSGTKYDIDIDTIVAFAQVGIQADVLDLSGLTTATLANTDLLAICQTSTAYKSTIAALETLLWTDYNTWVAALTAVVTTVDSDKFYCIQGSTSKYMTATTLSTYVLAEIIADATIFDATLDTLDTYLAALTAVTAPVNADLVYCTQSGTAKKLSLETFAEFALASAFELPWQEVSSSKWTAIPASTSTITMTDTSDFTVGLPVKYVYGGTSYYGIVTAVSANALLTIAGATLDTGAALTAIYVGLPSGVEQRDFLVETAYGDASQDIFSAITYERHRWDKAPAYLVAFSATHGVADSGASQPKLNVKIDDNLVSTEDTNSGLQLHATPGTWTDNSAVEISTSNYAVSRGDNIELRCTTQGDTGDADVLSVSCLFVYR